MDSAVETNWIICGNRIRLRKVVTSDVHGNYYKWMNDPKVMQFLEAGEKSHSIGSLQDYVQKMETDQKIFFLAIIERNTDKHIGNIKLGPINPIHRRGDVGILIGEREYWGRGYATEAISLVKELAFKHLKLHKLTAGCSELNVGSLKAFQKNGFEIEGKRKEQFFLNGRYFNSFILGLINSNETTV